MKKLCTYNLDVKYIEKLKKIAKENKRSASNMIEVLIDMYMKRGDK